MYDSQMKKLIVAGTLLLFAAGCFQPHLMHQKGEYGTHKITGHRVRLYEDHHTSNHHHNVWVRVFNEYNNEYDVYDIHLIPVDEIEFDEPAVSQRKGL
jgi:hypothetical protein